MTDDTTYTVTMTSGYTWQMLGDFTQSASPLRADFHQEKGSIQNTPYQVADARHIPFAGAELLYDYWRESDDDDTVSTIEEILPVNLETVKETLDTMWRHDATKGEIEDWLSTAAWTSDHASAVWSAYLNATDQDQWMENFIES